MLRTTLLYLFCICGSFASEARAQLSIEAMFERMQANSITGTTVITHGFTPFDGGGGSLLPLAEAIRDRLMSQSDENVWLLDYDLADDGETGFFNTSSSVLPDGNASGQSGHAILLYDWGPESNETSRWWAESAGDALFALGTGVGMFSPATQSAAPVHFIAHSFGTVATSEAVERLAGYNVPVDQLTLLDPHDFDQPDVPTYDDAQRLFELGAPEGYGATVWNNVAAADVYYQTRGEQGGAVALITADPEGRPIAGAYNRHLDDAEELPAGDPYGNGVSSDHSYAWNTFYMSTATGTPPTGAFAPAETDFDYSQTGWAHSIHNTAQVPMPDATFYDAGQDHQWTDTKLANPDGSPHTAGLAELQLTAAELENARWAPSYQPGEIVNGDFEAGDRTSFFVDIVAGWSHHGGGGDSEIDSEATPDGENRFLRLDSNDISRTHNYQYIPATAEQLLFDMRVPNPSGDDTLELLLGGTLIATMDLPSMDSWMEQAIDIPIEFRDTVDTLSIRLDFGSNGFDSPEVEFDNFEFALVQLEGDYNSDGIVDLGDYTLWRDQLGSDTPLANEGRLGTPIASEHYQLWRTNFGQIDPFAAHSRSPHAVPEPAAWVSMALGLAFSRVIRGRSICSF